LHQEFENLEPEWPLFYIFMIIDGIFRNLPEQVEEYQNLLRPRISMDSHGGQENELEFLAAS
jgi:phosphorylase kinase alpha/beta subunit